MPDCKHRSRSPVKALAVKAMTGAKPAPDQTNLAEDPRFKSKLAEMEALLLAEMRRLDDPYRLWNQPDDGLPAVEKNARKGQ